MNILFLRKHNPYMETGASANRFRGLIDGICKEGHHVTIGITGGLIKKDEISDCPHQPFLDFIYLSKANHYQGTLGRLNTYFFDTFHIMVTKIRLNRLMCRDFDLVWLTSHYMVLKLYLNQFKKKKCKTFIELNEFNDVYKEASGGNFLHKRKVLRDNKVFMEAIGKIDLFAVMTNTLTTYYKSLSKPNARFIHLPMTVDLSRFDKVNVEDGLYQKPYIGYTGTMNNQKDGVDVLLQAFAKVANKYPTLHLYLAGFWHYDVPMQDEMITRFGLNERIHRVGVLNREQIPVFIGNASLLVLSRPDSHQAQGGFPTKLGEYLATSNPVCVTKVGEIPDYLEDNVSAFMATPGDIDSFANAMDRALSNADNAKMVGLRGRKVAELHFCSEMQAKRLAEFLVENI